MDSLQHESLQRLPQPLRQRLRVDEIVQCLIVGGEDVVAAAAPGEMSLVDERDGLADGDDGVQVVGVDDRGGVELVRDFGNELVYEQRGLGVKAGVGLVEKEVFGVAGEGAGNARRSPAGSGVDGGLTTRTRAGESEVIY